MPGLPLDIHISSSSAGERRVVAGDRAGGREPDVVASRRDVCQRAPEMAQPEVAPVGLGARDSLRLEAGLCLYGHDIDAATTPVEADLAWALSKARRADGARAGGYPGAAVIARELAHGVARRRVGLRPEGRVPVREGAELVDGTGRTVGRVTSGGFGPTVGGPIAMGYVETASARAGTALQATVRGQPIAVEVANLPFVPHRYYRG